MYKLVISDTVKFQVKLSVNDAGVKKEFSLWLEGKRLDMDHLKADLDENGDMKVMDFHAKVCRDNLTGWSDQRLVVGDDGQPAAFSAEALDCLLSLTGAVGVIHGAYMDAIVTSGGTAGRAKNS
jgi:hypothetical protein